MKRLPTILVLAICWLLVSGTKSNDTIVNDELNAYFGFSINPTANSGLITYAVVEADENNNILSRRIVTRDNWIKMMRGEQYSKANPNRVDMWTEHEIGDCFWMLDPLMDKYEALSCQSSVNVDDLWRLRYAKNPQFRQDKITTDSKIVGGWAANAFRPNWPQLQILQKYGITYINDFFFGENMFLLMKDIQDDTWRNDYVNAM